MGRLVVQRSRAYVKKSQQQHEGEAAMFPTRQAPKVADYSIKQTYGRLLDMVEESFSKKNPLFSKLHWTDEAVERIFRVQVGYMRQRTQERVEALADERGVGEVDLGLVEAGIEIGRRLMEEVLGDPSGATDAPKADRSSEARGDAASGGKRNGKDNGEIYLNEVSLLSAMAARRKADAPDA